MRKVGLEGLYPSVSDLAESMPDLVADMALLDLVSASGEDKYEFTAEQVNEKVKQLCGVEEFDSTATMYYNEETERCMYLGRGEMELYYLFESIERLDNGDWEICLISYEDRAYSLKFSRCIYITSPNGDGTYHLKSVGTEATDRPLPEGVPLTW